MRPIDADALLEREGATRLSVGGRGCGKTLLTACRNHLNTVITTAPTIDAVPVVRCKDCKHMAVVGVGFRWCKAWERMQTMGDDGFCSRGERRSDD